MKATINSCGKALNGFTLVYEFCIPVSEAMRVLGNSATDTFVLSKTDYEKEMLQREKNIAEALENNQTPVLNNIRTKYIPSDPEFQSLLTKDFQNSDLNFTGYAGGNLIVWRK